MLLKYFLMLFVLFSYTHPANAGQYSSVLQVQCLANIGILNISDLFIDVSDTIQKSETETDRLWKEFGIIAYQNLVYEQKNEPFLFGHTVTKSCQMSDNDNYNIEISPYFFNRSPSGHCGTAVSFAITVTFNGHTIIDELPTQNNCNFSYNSQPFNWNINNIVINHLAQDVVIRGYRAEKDNNFQEIIFSKHRKISKEQPISHARLY